MIEVQKGLIWKADMHEAQAVCVDSLRWNELGIESVICVAQGLRLKYAPELTTLSFPFQDSTRIPPRELDLACAFYTTTGPTLVHCMSGLNRSSAICIALCLYTGSPWNTAITKTFPDGLEDSLHPAMKDSLIRWAEPKGWWTPTL